MADREAVDNILDRVFALPSGSPERGRAIADLIMLLDVDGDLRSWSKVFIERAPDRADAADEYRAIAMEAIFRALIGADDLRASNRIGVLYQVVRRAVMRHVSFRESGFTGLRSLSDRTDRYRRIHDELADANHTEPTPDDVFDAAEAEDANGPGEPLPKLRRTEAALYARGGRILTTDLSVEQAKLLRDDVAEEADIALESVRVVRAVVDSIISTYREQTGLLWYAMVAAEARQRSAGPDDVPKIARRAGIALGQAMRYRAIVAAHPRLDAAISSGADGYILEVALDEAPNELGFVTWSRLLLRAVVDAAPGEAGLLTYAHAWMLLAADLGRNPSSSELVRAVEERTGVQLTDRRVRGYKRALMNVLDEIRAAEAALPQ